MHVSFSNCSHVLEGFLVHVSTEYYPLAQNNHAMYRFWWHWDPRGSWLPHRSIPEGRNQWSNGRIRRITFQPLQIHNPSAPSCCFRNRHWSCGHQNFTRYWPPGRHRLRPSIPRARGHSKAQQAPTRLGLKACLSPCDSAALHGLRANRVGSTRERRRGGEAIEDVAKGVYGDFHVQRRVHSGTRNWSGGARRCWFDFLWAAFSRESGFGLAVQTQCAPQPVREGYFLYSRSCCWVHRLPFSEQRKPEPPLIWWYQYLQEYWMYCLRRNFTYLVLNSCFRIFSLLVLI